MDKLSDLIFQGLPSAPSCSPAEAQRRTAKMRVDTYNGTEGELIGYECPKCKNRGMIAVLLEDYHMQMRECSCMKIRRCVRKMEESGLREIIRSCTFDAFKCTSQWQKAAKEKAIAYAASPSGWFLLCGQSGAGKTHLCTAICRKLLLEGHEVIYMPWRDDIAQIKTMSLESEERNKRLQELKCKEILCIDDLFKNGKDKDGAALPTRADVDIAFEILNYRYNNRLLTIISTEKSPQELLEIDEAVGGRIAERAGEFLIHISPDRSKNYRLRNVIAQSGSNTGMGEKHGQ